MGKLKSPALTMTAASKPYDERNMPVYTVLSPPIKKKRLSEPHQVHQENRLPGKQAGYHPRW